MKQLKSQEFQAEVLESKVPVLVDFSATWCGPCQMMGPVLEQLSAEYEGKAKIVKVDIDESMDLAQKYRIMSVPNMIIFKDGAPVDAVIACKSSEGKAGCCFVRQQNVPRFYGIGGFFIAVFGTWIVYFVSRNFLLYDFFVIFAENGVKMYKNRYNERKILAVFSVDGKKRK